MVLVFTIHVRNGNNVPVVTGDFSVKFGAKSAMMQMMSCLFCQRDCTDEGLSSPRWHFPRAFRYL